MHDLLFDMAVCTVAAWVLGVLAQLVGQPVILAYLVAGFVLGPSCLGLVRSEETIATISELGLIFLLFMIGLEIDLKKIIRSGSTILVARPGADRRLRAPRRRPVRRPSASSSAVATGTRSTSASPRR